MGMMMFWLYGRRELDAVGAGPCLGGGRRHEADRTLEDYSRALKRLRYRVLGELADYEIGPRDRLRARRRRRRRPEAPAGKKRGDAAGICRSEKDEKPTSGAEIRIDAARLGTGEILFRPCDDYERAVGGNLRVACEVDGNVPVSLAGKLAGDVAHPEGAILVSRRLSVADRPIDVAPLRRHR